MSVIVGQHYGSWRVLVADRRRTTCICICGCVRILSTDELLNRTAAASCGCTGLSNQERAALREEEAARGAARTAAVEALTLVKHGDLAVLRAAANRLREKPRDQPHTPLTKRSNLDILLDDDVSFDTAMFVVTDRYMRGNPAANSTIDALMFSLRSGTAALKRQDVRQRLAALDERQLRDICKQLLNRHVAKPWSAAEVEMFVMVWTECHHGR